MPTAVNIRGYRTISYLGAGAFAEVWQIERDGRGWQRAAKVLHTAENLRLVGDGGSVATFDEARARFEDEADLLQSITHPHVVRFYDLVETEDGRPALLLELCSRTLFSMLGLPKAAVEPNRNHGTGVLLSLEASLSLEGCGSRIERLSSAA